MTKQMGVTLRQLQLLRILWEAGEPILRSHLLSRFHELYGKPIGDATLRGLLMRMHECHLIDRQPAPREPGTRGNSFTLYSARPKRADLIPGMIDTIFADALDDDPESLQIALKRIQSRLRRSTQQSR
jgi:hypothetical protein